MINLAKNTILIVVIFLAVACSSSSIQEVEIPSTVIPKDSMVSILVDVHLLEATIDLNIVQGIADPKKTNIYYQIFEQHKIRKSKYDSSLFFYSSHPEILNKIYDKVIAELSKKQAELNKH